VSTAGVINANELYGLPEAKRRLGVGRHSFDRLRRTGLPLLKVGRNVYVTGADIITAIGKAAAQQAAASQRGKRADEVDNEDEDQGDHGATKVDYEKEDCRLSARVESESASRKRPGEA
jgi:hypothetical protein